MKQHIDKLNRLSESHGALQPGKGMVTGVIALDAGGRSASSACSPSTFPST